jgi:hypothetical protein
MPPKKIKTALPTRLKKPKKIRKLKINPKKHISVFENILHPYLRYGDKERQINIDNKLVKEDSDYESESESSSSNSDSEGEFKPTIQMGNRKITKAKDEEIKFKGVKIGYIPTDKDSMEQRYLMREGIIPRGYSNFIVLSAGIGMGKTNCLINMLLNGLIFGADSSGKPYYDNLYVFTNSNDDAYDVLIEQGVLKPNNIKHMPTPADLKTVLDMQKKAVKEAGNDLSKIPNTYLIFDDIIDNKEFINSKEFLCCCIRPRQYRVCSFLLQQHFNSCPRICRVNAQNFLLWNATRLEAETYYEMFCPSGVSKKAFNQILDYAWTKTDDDKFPFLHINKKAPIEKRFYKNFTDCIYVKQDKNE